MNRVAEGLNPLHSSFDWFWIVTFGGLAAVSVIRLFRPPANLRSAGSWSRALLAVPLFGVLGLLVTAYAVNNGYYHGFNLLAGLSRELSGFLFGLVLILWLHLWLVHKVVSR